MPDFPKASELFRIFRDEAVSRSQRLTVNAVDRDGTDANIMGYGGAVVGEEVIGQLATVEESFWLDSSRGKGLDKWAWDRYGMTRKPAAPAFVNVRFTTTNGNPIAFQIPAGTRVSTPDGVEFRTVVAAQFPMGSTGPVDVLSRSTLAGIDQNIGSNSITGLTSRIVNAPADLVVSNIEAATGGDNVEEDPDFKNRIRRFWVAARRGTKGAIETGALAVPGVKSARAFEGLQSYGYPTRAVTLVISDQFTEALVRTGQTISTYDTKSQALAQVVFAALGEFRAYGMPVNIIVAQVRMVPVVLRLRFAATVANTDALALYARTLVVQYINQLRPGDMFDPAEITDLLRSVSGLDIFGDEVASPVGAIIPTSPYQVLRSSLSIVGFDSQATLQSQAASLIG
jgi:hypothetical protein